MTFVLGAIAAYATAGSTHAALALVAAGVALTPPAQELVARLSHVRAPPRVAFFAVITMIPFALFFLIVDGVAMMDARARAKGFASAAEFERARDLGITTAEALAARDAALRKAERDRLCQPGAARWPALCFDAPHLAAAHAYAAATYDETEHQQLVRDVIADQRKDLLAADKSCLGLIDRIESQAMPAMLSAHDDAVGKLALIWVHKVPRADLELATALAKPGTSYMKTPDSGDLERRIEAQSDAVQDEFEEALKAWSRDLVLSPTGLQALFRLAPQIPPCKRVEATLQR